MQKNIEPEEREAKNRELAGIKNIYDDILDTQTIITTTDITLFQDQLTDQEHQEIRERAKEFLHLFEGRDRSEIRGILEQTTIDEIQSLENSSALLGTKMENLDSISDTETNEISRSLSNLSQEISNINPSRHNLSTNSMLSILPFVGRPIDRYLKKFRSASSLIEDILSSLDAGEKLLRNDNIVLQHDKDRYRQAAIELQRKAITMQIVIDAIEKNIESLSEDEQEFYRDNLILNLQKKIRSIYEILVVTQEGFLSNDFIIDTNWELIDNISNVKTVTKRALEIGVSMLVALENQKNVIDAIEKTKEATNELLVGNAERMNRQGTEIYEKASRSTLDTTSLQEAFENIDEAMEKIDRLKREALKDAKNEVNTLREVSRKLEAKIDVVEKKG